MYLFSYICQEYKYHQMVDFFDSFIDSFHRNLIAGDAYLVVLKGFRVTLLISALGLFFGTLFGAILCFLRMTSSKMLQTTARLVIAVLRGSPVLLLLMILYYHRFSCIKTTPNSRC